MKVHCNQQVVELLIKTAEEETVCLQGNGAVVQCGWVGRVTVTFSLCLMPGITLLIKNHMRGVELY